MSPRAPLALVSLVLIAGGLLLTLFILIAGGKNSLPVNKFYFLRAETSGIGSAADTTRWTLWNACSEIAGKNACPGVKPAYPFDPARNFGTTENVPPPFLGTRSYYFGTRAMFAFILIQGLFAVFALLTGLLALCSRIGSFLTSLTISVALFFQGIAAGLMTAYFVRGRNAFRSVGRSAGVGNYNFGFMWAIFACYFIAMVLLCAGGAASKSHGEKRKSKSGGGLFGRKKSKRSNAGNRGSFFDKEAGVDGERSSFQRER